MRAGQLTAFLHSILLLALCGVLYFPYLNATPFFDKGEPREALAVQDIVQRGEWLFPLKRATAIPSKPPMFHWSAALTSEFTGVLNETTIRFPSAFYATLGVLLLYFFGRKAFGAQVALLGGAILATTMVYFNHALSARVDMTLCFFVSAALMLFYSLYRGWLSSSIWYFCFYGLIGFATLAKGPLGMLLPALVIAAFLALRKRWEMIWKFAFHPGVLLTLALVLGWYGLAITRGGEGFVNRQLLSENLNRFFGGSGHTHPVYYYVPYLFSLGLPWALFFPPLIWQLVKKARNSDEAQLFLVLWVGVMFLFFSISAGKRLVYILPLYPALALLLANWVYHPVHSGALARLWLRAVALFAAASGAILLLVVLGDLWGHDPGWFFAPLEKILKPRDRANMLLVKNQIVQFGWRFDAISTAWALSWFAFGYFLWRYRVLAAGRALILISILLAWVSRGWIEPEIARNRSYREFMTAVNRLVKPDEELLVLGSFNSDPVIFYRGSVIEVVDRPAAKLRAGNKYIITAEKIWLAAKKTEPDLTSPLLRSVGKGPDGDAPLVLLRAEII